MSDFEKISDEGLIDAYQHLVSGMSDIDETITNLCQMPVGEPYGVVKGMERLEQGKKEIREELQERDIDPEEVTFNV